MNLRAFTSVHYSESYLSRKMHMWCQRENKKLTAMFSEMRGGNIRNSISLFFSFRYQLKRERNGYLFYLFWIFYFYFFFIGTSIDINEWDFHAGLFWCYICKSLCCTTSYWSMEEITIATRGPILFWFDKEIHYRIPLCPHSLTIFFFIDRKQKNRYCGALQLQRLMYVNLIDEKWIVKRDRIRIKIWSFFMSIKFCSVIQCQETQILYNVLHCY